MAASSSVFDESNLNIKRPRNLNQKKLLEQLSASAVARQQADAFLHYFNKVCFAVDCNMLDSSG